MNRRATLNTMPKRVCHQYYLPRRPPFICQVVLPLDLTSQEAERICAFISTLAVDFSPIEGAT